MSDLSPSPPPADSGGPPEETYATLDARRAVLVEEIRRHPGGTATAPLSLMSELADILSRMRRKTAGPPKKEAKKSPKFVVDLFD